MQFPDISVMIAHYLFIFLALRSGNTFEHWSASLEICELYEAHAGGRGALSS